MVEAIKNAVEGVVVDRGRIVLPKVSGEVNTFESDQPPTPVKKVSPAIAAALKGKVANVQRAQKPQPTG